MTTEVIFLILLIVLVQLFCLFATLFFADKIYREIKSSKWFPSFWFDLLRNYRKLPDRYSYNKLLAGYAKKIRVVVFATFFGQMLLVFTLIEADHGKEKPEKNGAHLFSPLENAENNKKKV